MCGELAEIASRSDRSPSFVTLYFELRNGDGPKPQKDPSERERLERHEAEKRQMIALTTEFMPKFIEAFGDQVLTLRVGNMAGTFCAKWSRKANSNDEEEDE
jgi:hypothetical protein